MTDPIVSANTPIKVTLEKDKTYYYCRCGRSQNQPFCDGAHAGTAFTPLAYKAEKDGDAWLCACKHTGNVPFVMVPIPATVMRMSGRRCRK